jgi:hypothetical protein
LPNDFTILTKVKWTTSTQSIEVSIGFNLSMMNSW